MGATTSGKLVIDKEGCLRLAVEGNEYQTLLWPAGYTQTIVGDVAKVMNRQGHVVATSGQQLTVSGGYVDDFPSDQPCVPSTHDGFEVN